MNTHTILLVEDSADDEVLTLRALEQHRIGNHIHVARDGAEALEFLLGDDPEPIPELVLLDLKLPKVDGLEVLRRIRDDERTALLPVVILTASREETDLIDGYSSGANSYVRKPVDFDEFSEAVRQLGLYWLLINEPPPLEDDERRR
jgi:two-component system response regulator